MEKRELVSQIKEAAEKRDYKQLDLLVSQIRTKEEWRDVLKDNKKGDLGMFLKYKHAFWEVQEKMQKLGVDPLDLAEEILAQHSRYDLTFDVYPQCLRLALRLVDFSRDPGCYVDPEDELAELDEIIEQAKALKEAYLHGGSPEDCSDEDDIEEALKALDDITFD